jgi:hypothetical protein
LLPLGTKAMSRFSYRVDSNSASKKQKEVDVIVNPYIGEGNACRWNFISNLEHRSVHLQVGTVKEKALSARGTAVPHNDSLEQPAQALIEGAAAQFNCYTRRFLWRPSRQSVSAAANFASSPSSLSVRSFEKTCRIS